MVARQTSAPLSTSNMVIPSCIIECEPGACHVELDFGSGDVVHPHATTGFLYKYTAKLIAMLIMRLLRLRRNEQSVAPPLMLG